MRFSGQSLAAEAKHTQARIHTIAHCRFYREHHLGPTPHKAGPGCDAGQDDEDICNIISPVFCFPVDDLKSGRLYYIHRTK